MTFIPLEDKAECVGIYQGGKLYFNEEISLTKLDRTWKYLPTFQDQNIEYAHLYCDGNELRAECPVDLKEEWDRLNKRLSAFLRSFRTAKLNISDSCIYDLIPKQFLLEFCETKSKIVDHIFEKYKKPKNYDFSLDLEKVLSKIKHRELNIDLSALDPLQHTVGARTFIKNFDNYTKTIDMNQFGTKTGRLTTKPRTFPILNLNSDYRCIMKPNNDFFLELDFNAAELRVLLALAEQEQPKGDIHEHNARRLGLTRDDAKQQVFAWLYGSSKVDPRKFDEIFETKKVIQKYYDGKLVTNYFGREIESDDFHCLNHIVQSTTSDMVLRQAIKIDKKLENKKTYLGKIIHDSLVLDVCSTERSLYRLLVDGFSNNEFGVFPVHSSIGKNFGSMQEVK